MGIEWILKLFSWIHILASFSSPFPGRCCFAVICTPYKLQVFSGVKGGDGKLLCGRNRGQFMLFQRQNRAQEVGVRGR